MAYRFFSTKKRSFIVADTPGHEEYTRNMAVGASFADLSIILLDASKGVLTQTRRHTYICSLMGIRHFVFAVNKMDLIDFDEYRFKKFQKMSRPNQSFRGFQGEVLSGKVAVGEEITVLPSGEKANVKSLIDAGKDMATAGKGHAVTIQLEKEIDVSRGYVLVKDASPLLCDLFTARLLWMDDARLVSGKDYTLRLGTKSIPAVVLQIKHKINVVPVGSSAAFWIRGDNFDSWSNQIIPVFDIFFISLSD